MIDLTHDGLNTSVSVEESNFLEKFIDSDVPEVGGKICSFNDWQNSPYIFSKYK